MRHTRAISKKDLWRMYITEQYSTHAISSEYECSPQKINYWLHKYNIPKRSISDAIYALRNPDGDPFLAIPMRTQEDAFLQGMGVGLYWGEGNKKNTNTVRIGNSDPLLLLVFINFLVKRYQINKKKLRFGLQIFSDMDPEEVLRFWVEKLQFPREQFYKVIVTPSRGEGSYLSKSKYGVLTVYFANKKMRDKLISEIEGAAKRFCATNNSKPM